MPNKKTTILILLLFVGIFAFSYKAVNAMPNFLYYPFDVDADDIKLQQGWDYTYSQDTHDAMDYIKGTVDQSGTWEEFDVVSSYDGQAYYCPDCSATWGNYVITKFTIDGTDYYNISAHLDSSPLAEETWVDIHPGEVIGVAGITGAANNVIHLHYEFSQDSYGAGYRIDPYDIENTRDYYPTYSSYSGCGADYAWTECPPISYDSESPPTQSKSGTISSNETWEDGYVYIVNGNLTIASGVTVTVDAGAIVKFNSTTSGITVNGTLDVNGTSGGSENHVYFTSIKDDYVGGDTNNDGFSTASQSDWKEIRINSGGEAYFDYTEIFYGGYYQGGDANIYNNGGTLSMANSVSKLAGGYAVLQESSAESTLSYTTLSDANQGFRISDGDAIISNSTLKDNSYGVYAFSGADSLSVNYSNISGNSSYGVYSVSLSVDAENNWWGASDGPSGEGPGSGDAVSTNVDFDPFENAEL